MAVFGPALIMSLPVQVMWPLHKEELAKSSVATPEAHGMDALSSVELLTGEVMARKKPRDSKSPCFQDGSGTQEEFLLWA